jgi:hypothetical protein
MSPTHPAFTFDPYRSCHRSLASLEAAAKVTFDGLLLAHPELNDASYRVRMNRRGIVARSILRQIERLSETIHRYQIENDRHCPPTSSVDPWLTPTRLNVPTWWSPREADAVFEFLSSMAQAVWDAHEPALVDIAMADVPSPQPPQDSDFMEDVPF